MSKTFFTIRSSYDNKSKHFKIINLGSIEEDGTVHALCLESGKNVRTYESTINISEMDGYSNYSWGQFYRASNKWPSWFEKEYNLNSVNFIDIRDLIYFYKKLDIRDAIVVYPQTLIQHWVFGDADSKPATGDHRILEIFSF